MRNVWRSSGAGQVFSYCVDAAKQSFAAYLSEELSRKNVRRSTFLSICVSICSSIYVSIYRYIDQSIEASIYPSIYRSIFRSLDQSMHLSSDAFICIYLPIHVTSLFAREHDFFARQRETFISVCFCASAQLGLFFCASARFFFRLFPKQLVQL